MLYVNFYLLTFTGISRLQKWFIFFIFEGDFTMFTDEELVTTTWREILAFLQQMIFEI